MDQNFTAIERAFQLAKSGDYSSVELIKKRLGVEGYSTFQITGRALANQLGAIIRAASTESPTSLRADCKRKATHSTGV